MEQKERAGFRVRALRQAVILLLLLMCTALLASAKPVSVSAKTSSSAAKPTSSKKSSKKIRVLFVGNSKTYKNDIPGTFEKIAKANGKKVTVDSVTGSGKTLTYLANNKKKKIMAKSYDYVVIQEHTKRNTNYSSFLKGAQKIVKYVRKKNPKVKVVVRKVWLLKNSGVSTKMKAYNTVERVAAEIGATAVANDGPAFDLCRTYYPNIKLFTDNRHQSREGAYLSACCVYASIFDSSPVGTTYKGNLSGSTAKKLQKVAAVASGYRSVKTLQK